MTIIESHFYIIDIYHWNEMLNWWLPGCKDFPVYKWLYMALHCVVLLYVSTCCTLRVRAVRVLFACRTRYKDIFFPLALV